MSIDKVKKRKKPEKLSGFIAAGWRKVDVGDQLLLGSEEGGFMELEEMAPPAKPDAKAAVVDTVEDAAKAAPSAAKSKKQKKQKEKIKEGGSEPRTEQVPRASLKPAKAKKSQEVEELPADVEGLKAKIAALQQENEALKCAARSYDIS